MGAPPVRSGSGYGGAHGGRGGEIRSRFVHAAMYAAVALLASA